MSLCLEGVNACSEALAHPKVVTPPHNDNFAILVIMVIFWGIVALVWWHYQGRHERNILTGASRYFERERELENERVMKRIIERRITKVTDKEQGGIFISQVTQGKGKPKYFKFTQETLAETIEDIYYYLTESRTSIHEHNFTIETKRIYS